MAVFSFKCALLFCHIVIFEKCKTILTIVTIVTNGLNET